MTPDGAKLDPHRRLSRRAMLAGAAGAGLAATTTRVAGAAPPPAATAARAPILYVSHGAPLFLPGNDARVAELRAWGKRLAKAQGVVVMTPHYGVRRLELGRTGPGVALYDLPGPIRSLIPAGLDYATPSNDALAARLDHMLAGPGALPRGDRGGFDHTTWMPLACLFPAADVPVIELSYPYLRDAELFALGQTLSPLRDEGIVFVASGQMTHNLAAFDPRGDAPAPPWSREFDDWARASLEAGASDALIDWRHKAPASGLAHPDDGGHFRVLLVALGLALGAGSTRANAAFPVGGFEGVMSKRCVEFD